MPGPASDAIEIVRADAVDPAALVARVQERWGGETVVAHGDVLYPARESGFVALRGGDLLGHAAYRIEGDRCELVAIEAAPERQGIGSRLLAAVAAEARRAGCRQLWLTTTNDNLDAQRFYQRRGFRLAALRPGAVDAARATLKPEIPLAGGNGIPIRDEIDLEQSI
jgi:ribosomal protein S18 acetylase RimI-like enzyme